MGAGMTRGPLSFALTLTRGWIGIYTWGTARDVAEDRRRELESDFWEMEHDAELGPPLARAWLATWRLFAGIPDDLAWRLESGAPEEQAVVRRVVAITAATLLVLSLWTVPSMFVKGRREVAECAATAPAPQTQTDLRWEVMRCAGAFFARR
jgi:hypothetical protein